MKYFKFKNYFYMCLINPFSVMNKLKGVFKPLQCYFRCSTRSWYPVLWCSKPAWIQIMSSSIGWKDKYDTPRYEYSPYVWIYLFGLNLIWYWDLPRILKIDPTNHLEDYWEQALWYLYYFNTDSYGRCSSPDIEKAKGSWPWQDYKTKKSSWNNKFLIK